MAENHDPTITDADPNANEKSEEIDKTVNFVKLHRSILEKKIWKDPVLYRLFSFILLSVKWDDDVYTDGAIKISLKPGEMVGSLSYLMKETGLTKTQTHFKLNQLRTSNTIKTEVKHGLTVITLINYTTYHARKASTKTDVKQMLNSDQTEVKQKSGTSKELKKRRNKEPNKRGGQAPPITPPNEMDVWSSYAKAYEITYGVPILPPSGKRLDELREAIEVFGEHSAGILAYYCSLHTPFYVSKRHILFFLLQDAQKISTAYMQSLNQREIV